MFALDEMERERLSQQKRDAHVTLAPAPEAERPTKPIRTFSLDRTDRFPLTMAAFFAAWYAADAVLPDRPDDAAIAIAAIVAGMVSASLDKDPEQQIGRAETPKTPASVPESGDKSST